MQIRNVCLLLCCWMTPWSAWGADTVVTLPADSKTGEQLNSSIDGESADSLLGGYVRVLFVSRPSCEGTISAATDDTRLWIASDEPGIHLESGFRWEEVIAVEFHERRIDVEQLKHQIGHPRDPNQRIPKRLVLPEETWLSTIVSEQGFDSRLGKGLHDVTYGNPLNTVRLPEAGRGFATLANRYSRRLSMAIRALPANWDHDPEDDGLEVIVSSRIGFPEDYLAGSFEFELYGEINSVQPVMQPRVLLGTWRVERIDMQVVPEGILVQLPWQSINPQARRDFYQFLHLKGKWLVPGIGVGEAVDVTVPILPDVLEQRNIPELFRLGTEVPGARRWGTGTFSDRNRPK